MLSQPFTFVLPADLSATKPPERRRITRDRMRLMTINCNGDNVEHTCFDGIREFLRPGDLFVFNTNRTLSASLDGCDVTTGQCVEIRC